MPKFRTKNHPQSHFVVVYTTAKAIILHTLYTRMNNFLYNVVRILKLDFLDYVFLKCHFKKT